VRAYGAIGVTFLTDFADQAVVLPTALAIALLLALTGWARGAAVWLLAVMGTTGAITLLKILFVACGPAQFGGIVSSPSGHTAAAILYGGLAGLAVRRCGGGTGLAFLPAPVVVVAFGLTRVQLGAHTVPEVVIGAVAGCAGVLAVLLLAGPPPRRVRLPRLLGPALFVAVLMHGYHLRAEEQLRHAGRFAWLAAACAESWQP
jgi:membrane-associated phospholipid phosphatase